MESFPSYDYPLFGNTPESAGLTGNVDFPYGAEYGSGAALTPSANATAGTAKPAPPFTLGVVFDDIGDSVSRAAKKITNPIKGAYWSLIGGVALIGIIAIVILGASTRFMRQMEGR